MNTSSPIFLYVALPCEAKPLVKHFKLKKETANLAFAIFRNNNFCLTVCGLGKTAMAAAVAYSQALFGKSSEAICLNIGIAGHKIFVPGDIYCVDKIIDADTAKNYYPQLTADLPCPTQPILTVSKATGEYPENCLYDMEASAFYETAIRFSSSELIQCLKIISDNENSGIEHINPALATQLIGNSIEILEQLILALSKLGAIITPIKTKLYSSLTERWHLSSSNQIKLNNLLLNWQIMTHNADLPPHIMDCKSGKEFLLKLEKEINQLECYSL